MTKNAKLEEFDRTLSRVGALCRTARAGLELSKQQVLRHSGVHPGSVTKIELMSDTYLPPIQTDIVQRLLRFYSENGYALGAPPDLKQIEKSRIEFKVELASRIPRSRPQEEPVQ